MMELGLLFVVLVVLDYLKKTQPEMERHLTESMSKTFKRMLWVFLLYGALMILGILGVSGILSVAS